MCEFLHLNVLFVYIYYGFGVVRGFGKCNDDLGDWGIENLGFWRRIVEESVSGADRSNGLRNRSNGGGKMGEGSNSLCRVRTLGKTEK